MQLKQKLLLLLISVLSVVAINAQDEPISVETNLVTVNIALLDKQGKPVKGLRQEQFEVFDDQTKQQISHFSAEDTPVSFGIVYDLHPTTAEQTTAVLDALRRFTKELPARDDFFLLSFNERGSLNLDFIPTAEQLDKQLQSPTRREPHSLYDAIYLAADKIRTSRNLKRTLIIISDSADNNSSHNFSELSGRLKNLDVQIYAVVFEERANWVYQDVTIGGKRRRAGFNDATALDREAMLDLTLRSGGTSQSPATTNSLELYEIYKEIAEELRRQYTISFYPTTANGKWHDLRINLLDIEGRKKFALTYRRGYQSPPSRILKN